MLKIIKVFLLIVIIPTLGFISCIEEYWPELDAEFDQVLVIDGRITNEPGPYTVKISTSRSLDSVPYGIDPKYDFEGYSGATVSIHNEGGLLETLTEKEAGIYQTSTNGIQGVIGEKYKISISTPNGELYESTFEELMPTTDIDYLDYKEELTQRIINNEEILDFGLRFYITSNEATEKSGYFFWELEETYEYHAAYEIEHIYDGTFVDGIMDIVPPYRIPKLSKKDTLFYCWTTDIVQEIFTINANTLSIPKVIDFPLNFLSYENEKAEFKYSLLVKQYSITSEAQTYLNKVIEQNKNQEGLYAINPYQIRGNITNTDNPRDPVLGYFMAASKSEGKRISYTAPYKIVKDTFRLCKVHSWDQLSYPDGVMGDNLKYLLYEANPNDMPFYLTHAWVNITPWSKPTYAIRFAIASKGCVDCRERGGTIVKPDFWDD